MILATAVYVLAAAAVVLIEDRLLAATRYVPVTGWLTRHLYMPGLRAFAVIVLIATAYPNLYGTTAAPPLGALVGAAPGRFDTMLYAVLAVTLLLPVLPGATRLPGLILAGQGITATCIVFSWLAADEGLAAPRYWMGWATALKVALALVAAHAVGKILSGLSGPPLPGRSEGVRAAVRLAAEVPVIFIYARALGTQLP